MTSLIPELSLKAKSEIAKQCLPNTPLAYWDETSVNAETFFEKVLKAERNLFNLKKYPITKEMLYRYISKLGLTPDADNKPTRWWFWSYEFKRKLELNSKMDVVDLIDSLAFILGVRDIDVIAEIHEWRKADEIEEPKKATEVINEIHKVAIKTHKNIKSITDLDKLPILSISIDKKVVLKLTTLQIYQEDHDHVWDVITVDDIRYELILTNDGWRWGSETTNFRLVGYRLSDTTQVYSKNFEVTEPEPLYDYVSFIDEMEDFE